MESCYYPLPYKILSIVYKYLPIEDKIFTMPKVSKIWLEISEREEPNSLVQFVKFIFGNRFKLYDYNDDEIKTIIHLAKHNNLISEILKKEYSCKIGISSFEPCQLPIINLKDLYKSCDLPCCKMDGISDSFHINYNSKSLQLSTNSIQSANFRCKLSLKIARYRHVYQQRDCYRNFNFEDCMVSNFEKKRFLGWKLLSNKKLLSLKMNRLIEDALFLQLKLHAIFYSYLNFLILSEINDDFINDSEFDLSFLCDQNGKILIFPQKNDIPTTCFMIQKKQLSNRASILVWYSEDYISKKKFDCSLNAVVRWSVYSLTVQRFAKKIGLDFRFSQYNLD